LLKGPCLPELLEQVQVQVQVQGPEQVQLLQVPQQIWAAL
jgi:hypothetical protein